MFESVQFGFGEPRLHPGAAVKRAMHRVSQILLQEPKVSCLRINVPQRAKVPKSAGADRDMRDLVTKNHAQHFRCFLISKR